MAKQPQKHAQARPQRGATTTPGEGLGGQFGETAEEVALFEFQHAALCYIEAFQRHVARQLIAITGDTSLSAQDCIILHAIRLGQRPKSITDVQHFLNRRDVANVQYSVKKLIKAGLVQKAARDAGRGTSYRLTAEGERVSEIYIGNRKRLVRDVLHGRSGFQEEADVATRLLMWLTGIFDHLSRTDRA